MCLVQRIVLFVVSRISFRLWGRQLSSLFHQSLGIRDECRRWQRCGDSIRHDEFAALTQFAGLQDRRTQRRRSACDKTHANPCRLLRYRSLPTHSTDRWIVDSQPRTTLFCRVLAMAVWTRTWSWWQASIGSRRCRPRRRVVVTASRQQRTFSRIPYTRQAGQHVLS